MLDERISDLALVQTHPPRSALALLAKNHVHIVSGILEQLLARSGGIAEGDRFDALVDDVAARTTDPYTAVDALLADQT